MANDNSVSCLLNEARNRSSLFVFRDSSRNLRRLSAAGERCTLPHLRRCTPPCGQPRLRALRAADCLRDARMRGVQERRLRFREPEGISSGFGRWLFTSDPSGEIAIVGGMFHRSLRPSSACRNHLAASSALPGGAPPTCIALQGRPTSAGSGSLHLAYACTLLPLLSCFGNAPPS